LLELTELVILACWNKDCQAWSHPGWCPGEMTPAAETDSVRNRT